MGGGVLFAYAGCVEGVLKSRAMSMKRGNAMGGRPGRLCDGPLLLDLLRLHAVQIIRGALRMGGG